MCDLVKKKHNTRSESAQEIRIYRASKVDTIVIDRWV